MLALSMGTEKRIASKIKPGCFVWRVYIFWSVRREKNFPKYFMYIRNQYKSETDAFPKSFKRYTGAGFKKEYTCPD